MCMRTNVIDAFMLRREGVVRCQWQWSVKYCLSCTSANQSEPDIVLLNKTWDKNGQRAPVDDRKTEQRRASDAVIQVAPRSGGSADLACKCALHTAVEEKQWVHNV
jgi:hypothetical protein